MNAAHYHDAAFIARWLAVRCTCTYLERPRDEGGDILQLVHLLRRLHTDTPLPVRWLVASTSIYLHCVSYREGSVRTNPASRGTLTALTDTLGTKLKGYCTGYWLHRGV